MEVRRSSSFPLFSRSSTPQERGLSYYYPPLIPDKRHLVVPPDHKAGACVFSL